jgi:hypothetical protein
MSNQEVRTKVLITVMTYPHPSEAVCKEALRTTSPFASPFGEFSQHQAN